MLKFGEQVYKLGYLNGYADNIVGCGLEALLHKDTFVKVFAQLGNKISPITNYFLKRNILCESYHGQTLFIAYDSCHKLIGSGSHKNVP